MAAADQPLPEGTDHTIAGASGTSEPTPGGDSAGTRADAGSGGASSWFDRIEELGAQGTDRARDFAQIGKDRTVGALDELVKMVGEAAGQVDEKIGSQYGDYARRAAQGLGGFTDSLRGKEVDELFDEARELVRKSPAIAIGTAAALGFVVARLVRAGVSEAASDGDQPGAN